MYKSFSMELAGRTLTVDIGRVCAQANGAALIKYGETTVLSTVVSIVIPSFCLPLFLRLNGIFDFCRSVCGNQSIHHFVYVSV